MTKPKSTKDGVLDDPGLIKPISNLDNNEDGKDSNDGDYQKENDKAPPPVVQLVSQDHSDLSTQS